jgi:hypothetical protein
MTILEKGKRNNNKSVEWAIDNPPSPCSSHNCHFLVIPTVPIYIIIGSGLTPDPMLRIRTHEVG